MPPTRVFIVDDDQDFAASFAMVLEGRNCEAEIAHSGEEAIAICHKKNFDIVFMDVKLPGKNGVESFLEVRKFKPDAKVVMMTGYSVEGLLEQAVREGVWDTMHKPLDVEKVVAMVAAARGEFILIADDDPDFAASLKEILSRRGLHTHVCHNGQEALECLQSEAVDVLLLDLHMPILDGLDTVLELRKLGRIIPTIIVTGYSEESKQAIEQLQALSVNGILSKPFPPEALMELVDSVLAQRNA